jgi:hypothetical protein
VARNVDRDALAPEDVLCGTLDPEDGVARFDPVAVLDDRFGVGAEIVENGNGGVEAGGDAGLFDDEAAGRLARDVVRDVVVAQVLAASARPGGR